MGTVTEISVSLPSVELAICRRSSLGWCVIVGCSVSSDSIVMRWIDGMINGSDGTVKKKTDELINRSDGLIKNRGMGFPL